MNDFYFSFATSNNDFASGPVYYGGNAVTAAAGLPRSRPAIERDRRLVEQCLRLCHCRWWHGGLRSRRQTVRESQCVRATGRGWWARHNNY